MLRRLGRIDQDELARVFAARSDPGRRYGARALEQLEALRAGGDMDTSAAITGGIPARWPAASEPLPAWLG